MVSLIIRAAVSWERGRLPQAVADCMIPRYSHVSLARYLKILTIPRPHTPPHDQTPVQAVRYAGCIYSGPFVLPVRDLTRAYEPCPSQLSVKGEPLDQQTPGRSVRCQGSSSPVCCPSTDTLISFVCPSLSFQSFRNGEALKYRTSCFVPALSQTDAVGIHSIHRVGWRPD